ncbi:hypothetical protein K4F52_001371 [Lecanicillium sp. MT-2017a]|nr:hypothetical protein K4F52_001371 [Lecanicillium sp. MT-2017a]
MTSRHGVTQRSSHNAASGLSAASSPAAGAVRPRNRRLISTGDDDNDTYDGSNAEYNGSGLLASFEASTQQQLEQQQTRRGRGRLNAGKAAGGGGNIGQFLGDSLAQSWTSVQGFASSLLTTGEGGRSSRYSSRSPNAAAARTASNSKIRQRSGSNRGPSVWGPNPPTDLIPGLEDVAAGSLAEREAALKAARTARVLESHDNVNGGLDVTGKHKRRNSDEAVREAPQSDEYLVYIHHVQRNDTYAGIILRYQCREDVFRRANGLWSRDSVQTRKWLTIPVDACEVRGRPCDAPSVNNCNNSKQVDLLAPTPSALDESRNQGVEHDEYFSPRPTAEEKQKEEDKKPWSHVRWVLIDSLQDPVEVGRVSRQTMGYFPPRRKKSIVSALSTPRQSSDFSLGAPGSNERPKTRRQSSLSSGQPQLSLTPVSSRSRGGSEAAEYKPSWMRRPGGVGTMGRNSRAPGPDKDYLNAWARKHFPGLNIDQLPSMSVMGSEIAHFGFAPGNTSLAESYYEQGHDTSSLTRQGTGLDRAAAAVETWLRGALAKRPSTPLLGARSKAMAANGDNDLIELTDTASDDGRLNHDPMTSLIEPLSLGSSGRNDGDGAVKARVGTLGKGKKDD